MAVTFRNSIFYSDDESIQTQYEDSYSKFVDDLKQQRLKGQYHMVTRPLAISTTVFFGILFIGISALLTSANQQVTLVRRRYDNISSGYLEIVIPKHIPPPIYFYYELKNTFLMHRSLNAAFCAEQLIGPGLTDNLHPCDEFRNIKYSCEKRDTPSFPFRYPLRCATDATFYAPIGGLGAIMFNDTFKLSIKNNPISWHWNGVVSDSFRNSFAQPEDNVDNLCNSSMFRKTVKPAEWPRHICEMGGYRNVDFIQWMQPSSYQNFKKFYRILNTTAHPHGLKPGVYRLDFTNTYWPLFSMENQMEKYFWILHPSWVGTEQKFLEVIYLVVGIGLLTLSIGLVGFQIIMLNRRKQYDDENDDC
ncbi:unnamed protein product [Caenorhabditis sp. 36 PRJEB53466]|nr:unnamed protein product [Caenorhabditis sp. 36 PRJEB53466]